MWELIYSDYLNRLQVIPYTDVQELLSEIEVLVNARLPFRVRFFHE